MTGPAPNASLNANLLSLIRLKDSDIITPECYHYPLEVKFLGVDLTEVYNDDHYLQFVNAIV